MCTTPVTLARCQWVLVWLEAVLLGHAREEWRLEVVVDLVDAGAVDVEQEPEEEEDVAAVVAVDAVEVEVVVVEEVVKKLRRDMIPRLFVLFSRLLVFLTNDHVL